MREPIPRGVTRLRNRAGMTLAELLIAVLLIGIGFLAAARTFGIMQTAIQQSKGKTLAANIAQEKLQVIMQKPYYEVLVTTSPSYAVDGATTIPYDTGYFPPDSILEGGVRFTRYTFIEVIQENSGLLEALPPTTPDTGMRRVTVTVQWRGSGGNRRVSIRNVVNNPDTVMNTAILKGVVRDSVTLQGIATGLVTVAENVGWRDNTDASGTYLVNLSPGSFNLFATAQGYFPGMVPEVTIAPNATVTQDFFLIPISTGSITGTAWRNDHLVISQVVASSANSSGFHQEYVELYNPTTSYVPVVFGMNAAVVRLQVQKPGDSMREITMDYAVMNASVPPYGFYLMANTSPIEAGGVLRTADATYRITNDHYPHILKTLFVDPQGSGAVGICDSLGRWIDRVGFNKGGGSPDADFWEGTAMNEPGGFDDGEQFLRRTSTAGWTSGSGHAYDSDDNSVDFYSFSPSSFTVPPKNSLVVERPVAGTPAAGAFASVNDGLSTSSTATLMGVPPYAQFTVVGVATGSWSLFLDSGTSSAQWDDVSIQNQATTDVGPVILSTSGVAGMISGTVLDANGSVIPAPGIVVSIGGVSYPANVNGRYSARLSTGTYDVIANPGLSNASYESQTVTNVAIAPGDVTAEVNFRLSQGGRAQGWVSRDGINALPGVSVIALDLNGGERDTEVTDASGRFTLVNLTTGAYTVQPVLDLKEASVPASRSITIDAAGSTVWAGSFTVTGAMGTVAGSVTLGGQPIQTGVLVLVSTWTLPLPPLTLSSSSLTMGSIYAGTSGEDGTYAIEVRGSTSTVYRVQGIYARLAGETPVISSAAVSNVTVNAGQTTAGVNFAW